MIVQEVVRTIGWSQLSSALVVVFWDVQCPMPLYALVTSSRPTDHLRERKSCVLLLSAGKQLMHAKNDAASINGLLLRARSITALSCSREMLLYTTSPPPP